MPPPTTSDQLLSNLRRSGLVPPDRLELELQGHPSDSPAGILDRLIQSQLLTPFQADRLRAGKYKGFILGDYTILDQLGGGSTGQVYLAEHNVMQRLAALKVLSVTASMDTVARERFFREARATAVLDHPNIIRVHDLRKDGPVFYLIMEYAGGLNLHQMVTRHGPLPWATAAAYIRQAAAGLQHIHDFGLVHRDVKPANLLITHDGTIKLLDLGLVRHTENHHSRLTEQLDKSILGTVDYLAPEQAVASYSVDIRADIYSLGATFYYILSGQTLFPNGRTAEKLMWQQLRDPQPIREIVPDLPEELAKLVHRMLAKDPAARPQTPLDVLSELAPWTRDPVPAPDAAKMPPDPVRRSVNLGVPPMKRITYSDFSIDELSTGSTGTGKKTPRTGLSEHDTPPPRSNPSWELGTQLSSGDMLAQHSSSGMLPPGKQKELLANVPAPRTILVPGRAAIQHDGESNWKLIVIACLFAGSCAVLSAILGLWLLK